MKNRKQLASILKGMLVLIWELSSANFLQAQEAILTSGDNFSSDAGNLSLSIGQISYYYVVGTNGSVNQGVQQPIELYSNEGLQSSVREQSVGQFNFLIYPNPVSDYLYLSAIDTPIEECKYQIIDLNGRIMQNGIINSPEAAIPMSKISAGIYTLRISNTQDAWCIKIFKK